MTLRRVGVRSLKKGHHRSACAILGYNLSPASFHPSFSFFRRRKLSTPGTAGGEQPLEIRNPGLCEVARSCAKGFERCFMVGFLHSKSIDEAAKPDRTCKNATFSRWCPLIVPLAIDHALDPRIGWCRKTLLAFLGETPRARPSARAVERSGSRNPKAVERKLGLPDTRNCTARAPLVRLPRRSRSTGTPVFHVAP